ncbi:TonB-dependent receptor domain-containing protein [Brevundimonas variabilis]|uniref:Outer membrane receptor protein involved in Fe transport n=1 Tax=Brevundimonas variabilis TaxID=74312 RepID=A0A7W9CFI8_9CAUL|nr:TonB-dependent receptor [Brevundimonas variabilis]MBB5744543.1 outer membrane receptor protein involved in Fe transport [Brevundimonas variabilis]
MKSVRINLLTSSMLAGLLAVAAAPAIAQTAPAAPVSQDPAEEAVTVDEIVVTGSRVRRDPTNAPTPLIQVSREELLTTGQSTVIDYLATIPALSNSTVPSDTTGSLGIGGLSLPNLRSLGAGRTLTLVDGRRHVGSLGGSLAVDVDTIPRLLIQNIEIVTGGAASVYGSDAVSGVLNFVLRKDFEGLEIDANYGQINDNGEATKRISALGGVNLFDDRLNLYAFAEYEKLDEVQSIDIDWLKNASGLVGIDADPTNARFDGNLDSRVFSGYRTLQRPRWGQTTLANNQQASDLNDPDVPFQTCASATSGLCYSVDPTLTYVFEGANARLANFGQRIGNTGASRPLTIDGDGDQPAAFSTITRVPESESQRYQVGANFKVSDSITAYAEAKYITEDTAFSSQPDFYDFIIRDTVTTGEVQPAYGFNVFGISLADNAYLPANLRTAIQNNRLTTYAPPVAGAASVATGTVAAPFARHTLFGEDRNQFNTRELQRYVVGLQGAYDQVSFVKNLNWDLSYTYGEAETVNTETGTDVVRVNLAADAVRDTAGVLGTPNAIVCRSRLIAARGGVVDDYWFGNNDLRDGAVGAAAVNACQPLNVFGVGNQSAEAINYIGAEINVRERNEQEQGIASVSGQLWDFWGAGPIGVALGYEYRRESTEAVGRDADTAGRILFLNTGPDFPNVEYTSNEGFAELSVPLFRDTYLGEYAELSGSYRYADYSTVGNVDVYGVNLVYRPVQDITFKTSYNTSVRVPDLGENFAPNVQTFANGFVDPCATLNINAAGNAEFRTNRIANCTALAQARGLTFDFAGATATNVDDFNPNYTGGIAGVTGGNPFLQPEESNSFTFSAVLEPRFIPNFSIVLDYYEIEIENVIAAVSAQTVANNCVNGPTLNPAACSTLFRNNPDIPFGLGAPLGDPVGGFIEGSINYAALKTRGLDFTANYGFDFEEMLGRNWGRLDYRIGGLWLIDQNDFLDSTNPNSFVSNAGNLFYPRVRFTSSLTYSPNETYSINWTADWQTANTIVQSRDFVLNADSRDFDQIDTGNFARHDFTVRWNVRDDLSVRAGVVNAFDDNQADYLGQTLYSNFDPYGRRFFVGLNYKAF